MSVYEQYGKLMVQKEILDGQIAACRKALQDELNKKPEVEEVEAE